MTATPNPSVSPTIAVPGGADWPTIVAGVGAAINAGVFLCFSAFIMPAVGELSATQGSEAMQAFNRTAVAPFTLVGLGTAVVCIVVIVRALRTWGAAQSRWALTGAVVFLLAAVIITFAANVPISASIDALHPARADAEARWADLYTQWVWSNHLRTLGSIAAAAVLAIAALRPRQR